jgi:hypothetical protein
MVVRNAVPTDLTLQHMGVMLIGTSSYEVTVMEGGAPVEGVLVCALTNNPDALYAYGLTDVAGTVTLDFGQAATTAGDLELTVTAYNAVPAYDTASIVPATGPFCIFDSYTVDDDNQGTSQGNGDGLVDAGEHIELGVTLVNVGNEMAYGVTATITSTSPYVTIDDDYEEFGDIAAGGTADCLDDFDVVFDLATPDGHTALFSLEATNGVDVWPSSFAITVGVPVLSISAVVMDDPMPGGNANGCMEPGETITMVIDLANTGSRDATNVAAVLSTRDPYVVVDEGEAAVALIDAGGTAVLDPPFIVSLTPDAPPYHQPDLSLRLTADGDFASTSAFSFIVGSMELEDDFEAGEGLWTHSTVTGGPDDWHMETARNHSPTHSWKFGGVGYASYSNNADGGLVSPFVCVGPAAQLQFWSWLDAEQYTSTYAWDGCVVEISTDEGETWEFIAPDGGYSHVVYSGSPVPLPPGTPCWSGQHGWRLEVFDLAAYENEMAMFRFRFVSDAYQTEEGWYVDDVQLSSAAASVEELVLSPAPFDYALRQNTPNPFNPTTRIEYSLPQEGEAMLAIYNVKGQLVRTLVEGWQPAGHASVGWDGTNALGQKVASGIYLYRLEAGEFNDQRTMVLLK